MPPINTTIPLYSAGIQVMMVYDYGPSRPDRDRRVEFVVATCATVGNAQWIIDALDRTYGRPRAWYDAQRYPAIYHYWRRADHAPAAANDRTPNDQTPPGGRLGYA